MAINESEIKILKRRIEKKRSEIEVEADKLKSLKRQRNIK